MSKNKEFLSDDEKLSAFNESETPSEQPENDSQNDSHNDSQGENSLWMFSKMPRKSIIVTFLFSLLASLVMWLVAVDYEATDYEESFTNIEIKLVGAEQTGMEIELVGNVRLDITVSGKRSLLSTLKASSFEAWVDVSAIEKEGKSAPLPVEIDSVGGVTVVSQTISHITVTAEKRVTDTFEIIPLLGTVQLESGVDFKLLCDTPTVSVTGSESLIKNIKRAVAYVNPEPKNVKNSFRSSCLIVLESDVDIDPDDFIISPKYCGVDVILTKEKSVPVKIKLEGGADIEYGTSFKPDVSSILICGEPADVDGVESINVMIPYEKITNQLGSGKESFTVKGKLIYPDKIKPADGEATDITEIEVTVLVSKKVETVPKENVVISGCPLGYTASVSNVEIDLIGLYEELERINSSSVTVTVELSGVAPSVAEQKVKGEVYIETPFGTIYKKQCLVSVAFSKIAA